MEMTINYKNFPVPDARFERMMEIIRRNRDLVRQLVSKSLKDQENAGNPLWPAKEVSVG